MNIINLLWTHSDYWGFGLSRFGLVRIHWILHWVRINPFHVWYMHRHLLANSTLTSWQRWEHFHKETAFSSQHNTQKLHTIGIVQYTWVYYSGQLFSGAESGHWCIVSQGWYRRLIWYQAMREYGQTGSAWYIAARPTGDFTKHQRVPATSNTAYSTTHQAACSQPT